MISSYDVAISPPSYCRTVPQEEIQIAEEREEEITDAVALFSKKMKDLERGVKRGELDIAQMVKDSEINKSTMDRGNCVYMIIVQLEISCLVTKEMNVFFFFHFDW